MKCSAETTRGTPCKNQVRQGSRFCYVHAAIQSNGHALPAQNGSPAPQLKPTLTERPAPAQPTETPTREQVDDDPFRLIAEAMAAAAEKIEVEEQTPAAAEPPTRGMLATAMYSTTYGLSYGVMFPAFMALGFVPTDSAAGQGLRDGAEAAKQSVDQLRQKKRGSS